MAEDWSTLPLDLLANIVMKLETCKDFAYFSSVCQWWNYVSLLSKHEWRPATLPLLLLTENTKQNPSRLRKTFDLSNNKCHSFSLPETFGSRCFGSTYGWVASVNRDFTVKLFNPITKAQILYPSLEPMISHVDPGFDKNSEDDIMWFLTAIIFKLLVIKVPRDGRDEFVILVFNNNCLFYAKQGDQSWTLILSNEQWLDMEDIVTVDDQVFAMYSNGAIIYWNVMEFYSCEGVKPMDYCLGKPDHIMKHGFDKMYLVQSGSDLLMVLRSKVHLECEIFGYTYKTLGFDVYRLDVKDKSWEKIDNLGDTALFVGNNSSMSVSEAFAKGLKSGIYFTDDAYELWTLPKDYGGYDMGVYNLKWGRIVPFYEGDDIRSSFSASTWFIT